MSSIMTDDSFTKTMFPDKCVMMMGVENQETIVCNPEMFHILNSLSVFLFSTIIGVALSFAGVAYVIDYYDFHYQYSDKQDDKPYDSDTELTTPSEEISAFFKKYDDAFNALPASGYEIASYPFVCKAEEMTPMGKVVMFLHVDYDYKKNNSQDSIEYTYYSDKSGYTFNQVSLVAKKIAIDLGTREFYTDKTIDKTILYEAIEEENDNTNDNTNVVVKEDNEDNEANEKADNDDTTSVFAKFKKYNTSSSKNKTTTLNIGTHEITQRQSKIRRVGTLYEYEASLIKENAVKTIKDITFKSFKEQT